MFDYNKLSEEEQIEIVKRNGYSIQLIKNPSKAAQLAAVKQNGLAIEFIKNPSEEIKLAAVQQDGHSIYCIKNPSDTVIKYVLYECEISNMNVVKSLYKKLTSDEDKIYFKMKYGGIIND